jgi:hypothetical protein
MKGISGQHNSGVYAIRENLFGDLSCCSARVGKEAALSKF